MPTVTFVKDKKKSTVEVEPGTNLRQAALENGIELYWGPHKALNCLGFGHCGSCMVAVTKGAENLTAKGGWEQFRLFAGPITSLKCLSYQDNAEVRLACRAKVNGDVEVETTPPMNWHGDKFWG